MIAIGTDGYPSYAFGPTTRIGAKHIARLPHYEKTVDDGGEVVSLRGDRLPDTLRLYGRATFLAKLSPKDKQRASLWFDAL